MKKHIILVGFLFCILLLVSCTKPQKADIVSSASIKTNLYGAMSLEEFGESVKQGKYACSVATVNTDGSPNIAVFVPGYAGRDHVVFGWAPNATRSNVLRTKTAAATYDIADTNAAKKNERHRGAVLYLQLEEDAKTLEEIHKNNPSIKNGDVILKITKFMPIG